MSSIQFEIMVEAFHQVCFFHGGWLGGGIKTFTQKITDIACVACECDKRDCLAEEALRRQDIFKSLRSMMIHVVGIEAWREHSLSQVVAREAAHELACDSRLNMRRIIADALTEACGEPETTGARLEFGIGMVSTRPSSLYEDVGFVAKGDLSFRVKMLGSIWRDLSALGINPYLINDSLGMARRLAQFFEEEGPRILSAMEASDLSRCLGESAFSAPKRRI